MPTPPVGATKSTLQVGTYTALTDTFTSVLDLNDQTTFAILRGSLKLESPEKVVDRAENPRTHGQKPTAAHYRNRHVQATLTVRGASTAAIFASVRSFVSAVENPPYVVRYAAPGATQYSYFDVVQVTHDADDDPQRILAGAYKLHVIFECAPFIRGDRQYLQNLVVNPGFEAPAGGGTATTMPQVFNDSFANQNAYAVQAGSLTTDKTYYPDTVFAQGLTVLRYLRLGDATTASAAEVASFLAGTYVNTPTVGVAGSLTGDSDTAATFAAASSQRVSVPVTGLPTGGATSLWWHARIKFAANPAASQVLFSYGNSATATQAIQGVIDSSGRFVGSGISNDTTPGAALATGAYHSVAVCYNASANTISTWVDGAAYGTPKASFTLAVPGSPRMNLGSDSNSTPAFFFSGQLDEVIFGSGVMTNTIASALHTAASTTPATVSQSMRLAASSRVAFGSPAWGAFATWQARIRHFVGGTDSFYLHYTDASNYLAAQLTDSAWKLVHVIAGATTTLATTTATPGNEVPYWLQVTQFPSVSGNAPMVQATLYLDSGGAVGSQLATVGPVATQDAVTAMTGRPQIGASGNVLGIGGNYSNVHTMSLFGPGAWTFDGTGAAGRCSGAWDGGSSAQGAPTSTTANCYASGPATSFGAARVDLAPAGATDAKWRVYTGGTPAGTHAIPVKTGGDVLYAGVQVKSSGLGNGATIKLEYTEYNSSGVQTVAATALATFTVSGGVQAAYAASGSYTLSGNWTTNASTAFIDIAVHVADTTAGSANGIVYIDNAQVWDATTTGATTMPYCELRFPNSPAQLVVSGLTGDVAAPAYLAHGTYVTSWASASRLQTWVGLRNATNAAKSAQLYALPGSMGSGTPVLDTASLGGWYAQFTSTTGTAGPRLSQATSLLTGTYHLLSRFFTSNASPSTISTFGVHQVVTPFTLMYFVGTPVTSVTTGNAWNTVDTGQLSFPGAGASNLADSSGWTSNVYMDAADTVSATMRHNWAALLPVDASLVCLSLLNNNLIAITSTEFFLHADGTPTLQGNPPGNGLTLPTAATSPYPPQALPIASSAVGSSSVSLTASGTTFTNAYPLSASADPFLVLDPNPDGGSVAGTAQGLCLMTDSAATVLPCHVELAYSPLYLYPR